MLVGVGLGVRRGVAPLVSLSVGKIGLLIEHPLDPVPTPRLEPHRGPVNGGQAKLRFITGARAGSESALSAIRCSFGQRAATHARRGRQREKAAT